MRSSNIDNRGLSSRRLAKRGRPYNSGSSRICPSVTFLTFLGAALYVMFFYPIPGSQQPLLRSASPQSEHSSSVEATSSLGGKPPERPRETSRKDEHPEDVDDTGGECQFRHYPDARYYQLPSPNQPDFLKSPEVEYIYGKLPTLVVPDGTPMQKLCVDQSSWLDKEDEGRLPFADGTNPSILKVERLKDSSYDNLPPKCKYIATICMTNSQCQWKDSPEHVDRFKLSLKKEPNTVRTLLLLLDANFQVISQTTIQLERDARFGERKRMPHKLDETTGLPELTELALDDARLFFHANQVWISYREGKAYGYDKQVLNPLHIHLSSTQEKKMTVTIRASQVTHFCCGRNMALMNSAVVGKSNELFSLTWVDPVTVISVNDTSKADPNSFVGPAAASNKRRRLQENEEEESSLSVQQQLQLQLGEFVESPHDERRRRRLKQDESRQSHVHGTNAFMVEYKNEFLGMAHFHRPPDRKANEYARFGHHYTHAFFTITATEPRRLSRLSAEFVLQSKYHADDAEIIQFISGLEVSEDEVILAWGINDCEGAAATLKQSFVEQLLAEVPQGKEVVDVMQPLQSS